MLYSSFYLPHDKRPHKILMKSYSYQSFEHSQGAAKGGMMRVSPDRLFGLGAPVLKHSPDKKRKRPATGPMVDPLCTVRSSPHHRSTDAALDLTLGASSRARFSIGPWAKPVDKEHPGWSTDGSQIKMPENTWTFSEAYASAKRSALLHATEKRWAPGGEALRQVKSTPVLTRQRPAKKHVEVYKQPAPGPEAPSVQFTVLKDRSTMDDEESADTPSNAKGAATSKGPNQTGNSQSSSSAPLERARTSVLDELVDPTVTRTKDLTFVRAWANVEDTSGYTESQAFELFPVFTRADDDGDLEVHKEDLPSTIKVMGYLIVDEEEIANIANSITHYSTLSFEQFLSFVKQYTQWERAQWQTHFDKYDSDHSGEISADELKYVLEGLGYSPMREMLAEALEMIDSDGSGQVSLDEFMKLIEIYRRTEGFTTQEYTDLQQLFMRFDRDHDGELTAEEQIWLKSYIGMTYVPDGAVMKEQPIAWKGFLADMRRCREAEIKAMKTQFERYDEDGSGSISTVEMPAVLQGLGMTPLKDMLEESIAMVDDDKSGEISFEEFVHMMWLYRRSEGFTKKEIHGLDILFQKFDADNSGEISTLELGDILRHEGYVPNLVELQKLSDQFDVDGSATLGFREFLKIMRKFRESELAEFRRLFIKHDKDGSGTMGTMELAPVLRSLGHDVDMALVMEAISSVDNDGSGELDWEEFVFLMEKYRQLAVKDKRRRCGFNDDQLESYRNMFNTYDTDHSNDISPKELLKLLADLRMEPRSSREQKMVMQLLEECRIAAEESTDKITFWVFLRLMRTLEDDNDRSSLSVERKAAEEAKFNKDEVLEFREIFYYWADDLAKKGDGGGAAKGIRALTSDGVIRMLRSLGVTLNMADRDYLHTMARECDQDGNGAVDFPDFLIMIRRMLDENFGSINDVTSTIASKGKPSDKDASKKRNED
eukprot:gnl/MRDRNA2_/MRDRNA2_95929_c0_seq1.p1 gnl/MRDRNA2_/MRDRNA2_95929_c0~~gnl/MRDRNA2_/MRDRNA2_95929_c0_seq1.p1  ORF type:complete len:940 (+),score=186.60 gnl/MRDRNA2_/MRDRNA2_95929_c0_seq1:80-2899(+)